MATVLAIESEMIVLDEPSRTSIRQPAESSPNRRFSAWTSQWSSVIGRIQLVVATPR